MTTPKRRAIEALTKDDLLDVGRRLEVEITARMSRDELVDAMAGSRKVQLDDLLPLLSRDNLKKICEALGLPNDGREKQGIIDRILVSAAGARPAPPPQQGSLFRSVEAPTREALGAVAESPRPQVVQTLSAVAPAVAPAAPAAAPAAIHAPQRNAGSDLSITLDVEPRKPRLAWQGMERKELAGAVPTQVVEIVRPGRALEREGELGLGARQSLAQQELVRPENRLIWTNDNLVALQTLLDERDPKTKDWRYRGKVDLVYIDPPFMVNSDFRADNSIEIELDEDAGVKACKEPSLVEVIAYRDTWRQGLDSFISMLRARLMLLKELISPTGSIFVHLDWHAVHYGKIIMDEIFGYENFRNEIVWQRTTAHNDPKRFGRISDRLLLYALNANRFHFETIFSDYSNEQLSRFKFSDDKGRYKAENLKAPGLRTGETGVPWRGIDPNKSGRHWARPPSDLEDLFQNGQF